MIVEADSRCPICTGATRVIFSATLLGRHTAEYSHCAGCGLLRTQRPHWLDEAYTSAIAATDCGLVQRNLANARVMTLVYAAAFDRTARFIDTAGGYGLFTRLMRDRGFDCRWEDEHCENLLARGCECRPDETAAAITAFEVLEHVHDPMAFLRGLIARHGCRNIFLSTETYGGEPPMPGSWHYYTPETGQHIAFFQTRTLAIIAKALGLQYRRIAHVHALCEPGLIPRWLSPLTGKLSHLLAPLAARRRDSLLAADHARLVSALATSRLEGRA